MSPRDELLADEPDTPVRDQIANLTEVIAQLRHEVNRLRSAVETLIGSDRPVGMIRECVAPGCGRNFYGPKNRKHCSEACKSKAYRTRKDAHGSA